MRTMLRDVCVSYRLDPVEKPPMDSDPGASAFATIIPMMKQSTNLVVSRIKREELGASYKAVKKATQPAAEEGWADESDEEKEVPEL